MKYTKTITRQIVSRAFAAAIVLLLLGSSAHAQASTPAVLPQVIVAVDASGFIPFSQSYRLNYESKLAGLPIELGTQLAFPIDLSLSSILDVRYRRRRAVFLEDFTITQVEIIPGVRTYLEKEHDNDLRLYGSAGLLLAQSTVSGTLQATQDGQNVQRKAASKVYYNLGLGLGIGLEYEVSSVSSLTLALRLGVYLLDPVSKGGLGDAGGLSVGLGYRYAIF